MLAQLWFVTTPLAEGNANFQLRVTIGFFFFFFAIQIKAPKLRNNKLKSQTGREVLI